MKLDGTIQAVWPAKPYPGCTVSDGYPCRPDVWIKPVLSDDGHGKLLNSNSGDFIAIHNPFLYIAPPLT